MYAFRELVVLHPLVDLGLGHTDDVLSGVDGLFATADIQEIQTGGSLVQGLFITSRIAEEAANVLLDQSSGFGVVFLLANNLLQGSNLLSMLRSSYKGHYTLFSGICKVF